jgi:hypothetical protein
MATHREPGVIGRDLDPDGPMPTQHRGPKGWEQRARLREEANAEAMGTLRQMVTHLGGIFENTKAAPRNDVLGQMTQVIPSNGVLHKGWEQLAQAFTISNFGVTTLTVTTQGPQSQAPGVGSGVELVPPGIQRTLQLRGNAVTIYGLPGTSVGLVASARPRLPHAARCVAGPLDGALIPAGTTVSTTTQLVGNLQRLVVVLNVAATAGSVQLAINAVTPSGYVYPLLAPAAVAAPGVTPYRIGPALTPSAGAVANDVVPRTVQVVATVTTSATYGVDVVAGS